MNLSDLELRSTAADAATIEAILIEATDGAADHDLSAASLDDLDRFGESTSVAGTNTEPCVKTCGGCKG